MDLAQELERAIPPGPPLPAPESRTATARRALRRRRALQGIAVAGAVAALVVPVALAAGGPVTRGHDPAPPATRPSTAGSPSSPDAEPGTRLLPDPAASYPWSGGEVVAVDPVRGELLVRPGAVVLRRVPDLYPGKDTESVALVLRYRGLEYWAAWEWDDGGASGFTGSPRDPFYADFADFVAKATSGGGMTHGPPPRRSGSDRMPVPTDPDVTWTGSGFRAGDGVRVVEQRRAPDLPQSFAPPGTTTGAAYVVDDGVPSLVLYRDDGAGEPQLISVAATGHGDSLDELLAWAGGRYRSGAGLL